MVPGNTFCQHFLLPVINTTGCSSWEIKTDFSLFPWCYHRTLELFGLEGTEISPFQPPGWAGTLCTSPGCSGQLLWDISPPLDALGGAQVSFEVEELSKSRGEFAQFCISVAVTDEGSWAGPAELCAGSEAQILALPGALLPWQGQESRAGFIGKATSGGCCWGQN